MIKIKRNRVDSKGRTIRPEKAWFTKADGATKKAIKEGPKHKIRDDVYGDDRVRAALRELFHDKCAYCEILLPERDWPIDHFRPFGRVRDEPGHPGYYWLAYEWTNLYPACTMCNGPRKEKPSWENPQGGPTGGKWDRFPLGDPNSRAKTHTDKVRREDRLLLDPCHDDPFEHIDYSIDGQILARSNSLKGEKTIAILRLQRTFPKKRRKDMIGAAIRILRLIKEMKKEGNTSQAQLLGDFLQESLSGDHVPFSAAAKAVERDPSRFAV